MARHSYRPARRTIAPRDTQSTSDSEPVFVHRKAAGASDFLWRAVLVLHILLTHQTRGAEPSPARYFAYRQRGEAKQIVCETEPVGVTEIPRVHSEHYARPSPHIRPSTAEAVCDPSKIAVAFRETAENEIQPRYSCRFKVPFQWNPAHNPVLAVNPASRERADVDLVERDWSFFLHSFRTIKLVCGANLHFSAFISKEIE